MCIPGALARLQVQWQGLAGPVRYAVAQIGMMDFEEETISSSDLVSGLRGLCPWLFMRPPVFTVELTLVELCPLELGYWTILLLRARN